jgi:hypothetical protein
MGCIVWSLAVFRRGQRSLRLTCGHRCCYDVLRVAVRKHVTVCAQNLKMRRAREPDAAAGSSARKAEGNLPLPSFVLFTVFVSSFILSSFLSVCVPHFFFFCVLCRLR